MVNPDPSSGGDQSLGWGGLGALLGLSGLAGLFPNMQNQNISGWQNTNTTNAFNTGSFTDLYNEIQSILENNQRTTGTTTTSSSVTPTLSPETQQFMTQLMSRYSGMAAPSLTGYGAQQTASINQSADLQKQAVDNILAARGLSSSPASATAQAGIEQNRLNQITGMKQQLPILQNQLNLANLAGATGFFSTVPKGAVTTGTQDIDTTTRGIQTGSQTGHQFGNVLTSGSSSGTTQQIGQSSTKNSAGGGAGGAVSGVASAALAALPYILPLLSDKRLKKDIREIPQDKAITKIRELRGKSWKWKGGETEDSGFLAQEVSEVLPELVHNIKVSDTDLKGINYAGLIPYLVGAVQNLDSRISEAEG